jgi:plastocyanin
MRGKLQRGAAFRRLLLAVGLALCTLGATALAAVSGRMTIMDKGDRPAEDVGQAVIWLAGPDAPPPTPVQAEITTSEKELSPHVLVVPVGSTVSFPNHDPFNHNVFSLSEDNPFDLGLYGRG